MLYKKLRTDWDTLDVERKNKMRGILMNLLKFITEDKTANIQTIQRICMLMGTLMVRIIAEGSPNIIKEMIEFIPVSKQVTRYCLVHILCSSVEELEPFGVDRGRKIASFLLNSGEMVLQLLKMLLLNKNKEENEQFEMLNKKKCVECIAQWIHLGVDVEILLSLDYFSLLTSLLGVPLFFNEAVDAINFLFSSPHSFCSIDFPLQGRLLFERNNHQNAINSILFSTLQLESLYDKLTLENKEENEKIIDSITRLVVGIIGKKIFFYLKI